MKKTLLFLIIISFQINVIAQENVEIKQVNWQTFKEVGESFTASQKPVMVYLYSNSCDSCQIMNVNTFMNQEVVNYLNILFYNIKLDVETTDSVTFFDGTVFGKSANKKYNDIIYNLIGENVELPALLMFNKQAQGMLFTGFKDRDHIFPILIYYNEQIYNSVEYSVFEKNYFKAYPIGMQQIMTKLNIKWKSFDEMIAAQEEKPKKILIDIYYNYSIAATMMRTNTFNQPLIAKYLNENYNCTTVEAQGDDEVTIKGITYKNSGESHKFHQFAIAALEGKMIFPAFLILDEDYNLLDRIQFYLPPEELEPILNYYGGDYYKTMTYEVFKQTFVSSIDSEN